MPRPIRATIHRAALAHNLAVARADAPGAKVWAVVKANAYGHGIERAYPALSSADGFALLDLDEAARLRACGWTGPILLLEGVFEPADFDIVASLRLTPMLHTIDHLAWLEAARLAAPIDIYLKLNTGMNRLGFAPSALNDALQRVRATSNVASVSVATHFAEADTAGGIDAALARFDRTVAAFDGARSLSNSAATIDHPRARGDWVRAGIMLYGGSPFADREARALQLQPAMSLRTRVIALQDVAVGESVGYGARFTARRATRIAVVACGYADGYPRHAPDATPVWIDGVVCPLAGRVSMDMITVDVTEAPHVRLGSPVELWGAHVPIDTVAHHAQTVGYELMCALAPRVPVDVDDGDVDDGDVVSGPAD